MPGLGYSICEEDGYPPDVLEPLIDARSEIKAQVPDADGDERDHLEATSSVIKWILVSCFGYQGFSNAKFSRIECHEAINAYAREILLDAKEALEAAGWRVVHGIVDSILDWSQGDLGRNIDEVGATCRDLLRFDETSTEIRRSNSCSRVTCASGGETGGECHTGPTCEQCCRS